MLIEGFLFIIGVFGLIRGDLTISRNFPIKGRDARIVGAIFLLPYPLAFFDFFINPTTYELIRWTEFFPAMAGILLALVYLYLSRLKSKSGIPFFWTIALLPAVALGIAKNLLSQKLGWYSLTPNLKLPLRLRLEIPEIIIGILIPLVFVIILNLLFSVCTNKKRALYFAIPYAVTYFYFFSLYEQIFPGLIEIQFPNDTPGAGFQSIQNGLIYAAFSLLLLLIASLLAFFMTKLHLSIQKFIEIHISHMKKTAVV
jgi:hypothetical protein